MTVFEELVVEAFNTANFEVMYGKLVFFFDILPPAAAHAWYRLIKDVEHVGTGDLKGRVEVGGVEDTHFSGELLEFLASDLLVVTEEAHVLEVHDHLRGNEGAVHYRLLLQGLESVTVRVSSTTRGNCLLLSGFEERYTSTSLAITGMV